jgi:hypothetical protein
MSKGTTAASVGTRETIESAVHNSDSSPYSGAEKSGTSQGQDLTVEAAALSEAALLDEIVELTIDRDAYRMMAREAIHQLHALTQERRVQQERYHHLLQEFRELRERLLRRNQAA